MTAEPLSPDTTERRYECWNCGSSDYGIIGVRMFCKCGSGWSNRFGICHEVEHSHFELRETMLARQCGIELVDFTKPGALSSPA